MNNEHKFTPGPWDIGVNEVTIESPVGEKFLGVGIDGVRGIARVSRVSSVDEEDKANAALIASAPTLSGLLIRAVDMISSDHAEEIESDHHGDESCSYCEWIEDAYDAIEEATDSDLIY